MGITHVISLNPHDNSTGRYYHDPTVQMTRLRLRDAKFQTQLGLEACSSTPDPECLTIPPPRVITSDKSYPSPRALFIIWQVCWGSLVRERTTDTDFCDGAPTLGLVTPGNTAPLLYPGSCWLHLP